MSEALQQDLEILAEQISELSLIHNFVKTELGDLVLFRSEPIQGRNPRTGEALPEIPGKIFKYFLVSQRLFNLVFPSSPPNGYLESHKQELERMVARGFNPNASRKMAEVSISTALFDEVVHRLNIEKQFLLPKLGIIKAFAGPPPMIYLKLTD